MVRLPPIAGASGTLMRAAAEGPVLAVGSWGGTSTACCTGGCTGVAGTGLTLGGAALVGGCGRLVGGHERGAGGKLVGGAYMGAGGRLRGEGGRLPGAARKGATWARGVGALPLDGSGQAGRFLRKDGAVAGGSAALPPESRAAWGEFEARAEGDAAECAGLGAEGSAPVRMAEAVAWRGSMVLMMLASLAVKGRLASATLGGGGGSCTCSEARGAAAAVASDAPASAICTPSGPTLSAAAPDAAPGSAKGEVVGPGGGIAVALLGAGPACVCGCACAQGRARWAQACAWACVQAGLQAQELQDGHVHLRIDCLRPMLPITDGACALAIVLHAGAAALGSWQAGAAGRRGVARASGPRRPTHLLLGNCFLAIGARHLLLCCYTSLLLGSPCSCLLRASTALAVGMRAHTAQHAARMMAVQMK